MKSYITVEDKEIVTDDDGIMLSKYGEPFEPEGGGKWKLAGCITPGKKILNGFEPFQEGCSLVFFDSKQEGSLYSFSESGECKIDRDVLHIGTISSYHSKPIKEMKESSGESEIKAL